MNLITKIALVVFAVAFIALAFYAQGVYKENEKLSKQKTPLTPTEIRAQVAKTFRDSSGYNHTTFNNIAAPIARKELEQRVNRDLLDSIRKALDIKTSQADFYMKLSATSFADKLVAVRTIDSLKRGVWRYSGRNVDLTYTPGDEVTKTPATFPYKYNADISVVQYHKRRKVLGLPIGANETFIDVTSNDTSATVNGLSTFTVRQSEPSFGLRIQALSSYNFGTKAVSPGIGAQLDFKRVSLTGAYYWNSGAKQVRPTIGLRYDLIRF